AREVEAGRLLDPEADLGEREEHRQGARRIPGKRQQPDQDRAADRQPDQDRGEGRGAHLAIRKARTTAAAPPARKRTYVRSRPVWIRRTRPPVSIVASPMSVPVCNTTGSSISCRRPLAIATAGR